MVFVAFVLNLALAWNEELPKPVTGDEVAKIDEPLRHIDYKPTNRRNNFKEMGMDDDLAHAVATRIDKYVNLKAKLVDLLQQQAAEVGDAFCPTAGLPQPYAATQFLVEEENDRRAVVDSGRLVRFEAHPWFDKSPVLQVYTELESVEERRADATVMGVGALILNKEADVLDGASPWSRSIVGSWGYSALKRRYPKVEVMTIEYFSLMHFLTELANAPDGICR